MTRAVAEFWRKAYEDNLTGMASMVAYNLLLSLFPLALIALFIAGQVLSSQEVETSVVHDLEQLFPTAAESTLLSALRTLRTSSTTVGLAALVASLWVGSSFWGALDTAFCRIYHRPCRSWVRQKVFAIGMLVVVLLFFGATVTVPTLQGLVANASRDLPLGLELYSPVMSSGVTLELVPPARRKVFTDHKLRKRDDAEDLVNAAAQGKLQ